MVPLDFSTYGPLILATLLGFFALAAILLVPVYLFLKREEQVSAQWTPEQLRRQARQADAASRADGPAAGEDAPGMADGPG